MNRERFVGIWMQVGGRLMERWGTLINDPVAVANGVRAQRIGRIQEQRCLARQELDRQLDDFLKRNRNWWNLSGRRRAR